MGKENALEHGGKRKLYDEKRTSRPRGGEHKKK